jgi:uncharacterized membrane protein
MVLVDYIGIFLHVAILLATYYSVYHYFISDSVRHKMLSCYMYIELMFVLYVTLCLFGGP